MIQSKEWTNKIENIDTSRVLIADDDEATRILLRMSLTQWGYEVLEAKDGEEAWQILQKPNPPHILTLDWLMPKLDGISLCRRIEKELPFHPYIIFLSRMEGTENMIQGLEAGADEFILKPFDLAELRIRIFAGERIIKYRHQLELQKKQLEHYIVNMKQLAADYLQKLIPIPDLITLLQEINDGLTQLSKTHQIPEMNVWKGKIANLIDILKNFSPEKPFPPPPVERKFNISSVPPEKIVQETESVINLDRMHAFFGENTAGIQNFLKTFIVLASNQLKELESAIQQKDNKTAKYFFHLLGGASGNTGMMKIYDVCGQGETAVSESNWENAEKCHKRLSEMIKQLETEVTGMNNK